MSALFREASDSRLICYMFLKRKEPTQLYGPQPLKQTQRQAKNSDIWEIHFETQGFDPRVFVLSGLPDVISSFACQSRWHSGRAGWLAHINHGSLGEFEGASPCNLRPQAAKRPRERRSQRAALRSAPTHVGPLRPEWTEPEEPGAPSPSAGLTTKDVD